MDNFFKRLLHLAPLARIRRQIHHSDTIMTLGRKLDAHRFCCFNQEFMRQLNQDSCAIPCVDFRTAGPPMIQVLQDLKTLFNQCMRFAALHVGNKSYATSVMLMCRVV